MRFTIRDVLWLTVVVALAAAWFVEHKGAANARIQSDKALASAAQSHQVTKDELAMLRSYWNSLVSMLKFNGVTVEPGADMIHWKGKEFPVDFKMPVDPAPGERASLKPGSPIPPLPADKPATTGQP